MSDFALTTPTQEAGFGTAMQVIYQWNYDSEVDELRSLYVKAAEAQWVSQRQIDWDQSIDLEKFATTPLGMPIPIERTSYWKSLKPEVLWEVTKKTAGFRLSNFLHGEQGALMVAAQLVNAVPHTDAKFYAATQTMDEARHVEVFSQYLKKLGEERPIAPPLRTILDRILSTDNWMHKLVGMQIVIEGLALFSFKEMRQLTEEPLLKELLTYVARDEARHHAYGVQYIERCVPCLSEAEREELEDFAVECARMLIDVRSSGIMNDVLKVWGEAGVDANELLASVHGERDHLTHDLRPGHRFGPVQGFVIPALRRCGLLSERVAAKYHEFLSANPAGRFFGKTVQDFLRELPEFPADPTAWALGEAG